MPARSPSALSRSASALRAFLRDAWVGRVHFADWLRGWAGGSSRRAAASSDRPKRGANLTIESLEYRGSPNDPVGILQSALLGAGGTLLTPGMAFLRGWGHGQPVEVRPVASGDVTRILYAGPVPTPHVASFASALVQATDTTTGSDAGSPFTATAAEGTGGARGAGDNPTPTSGSDDWLDAVGDLFGEQPRRNHAGGAGAAGGGAGGGSGGAPNSYAPAGGLDLSSKGGTVPASSDPSAGELALMAGTLGLSSAPTTAAAVQGDPNAAAATMQSQGADAATARLQSAYAKAPLAFEENVGQAPKQVQYLSQGPGLSLFLTNNSAVLVLPPYGPAAADGQPGLEDVLQLTFTGANPNPQITASNDLLSRSDYYFGNQSLVNVPQFGAVTYHNLYPGIDLQFQEAPGGTRQLEYEFIVHPGANPNAIQLTWQGTQSITPDNNGGLLLHTAGSQLDESAPTIYQGAGAARQPISGQNLLVNGNQLSFQVGAYDPTKDLVIDPTLGYSSYLGGSGDDKAYAIAVDPNGSAYLTGYTQSSNFPSTVGTLETPAGSVFVTKLAPNGSLIYSAYFGGNNAGNTPYGIAADSAGDAYITGTAQSTLFPTTPGAFQTTSTFSAAFVTKLNADGSALDYSTYLGNGSTGGTAIAVDPLGNAYVTGYTGSNFPTTGGAYQTSVGGSFVTKVNPAGSGLVYSSYLGPAGAATTTGIALGQSATGAYQAYVTGYTSGSSFPTTAGAFKTAAPNLTKSGFVTAFNATGSALVYSTFLGGSTSDSANAIAVDRQGNAYVTGTTSSSNFPTTAGAFQTAKSVSSDAFATTLNPAGTGVVYSTYLGASGNDAGNAIAVDPSGSAYIAGQTTSSTFPTTAGAFQTSLNGASTTGFVTRLNSGGTGLAWSSYLGGGSGSTNIPTGIAVDFFGNAYVGGYTNATNFPTVNPYQGSSAGDYDAFISKILPQTAAPVITNATPNTSGNIPVVTTNQNLTLAGTAAPSSTVTIYRADLSAALGTTTANAMTGAWSFSYAGTTLPAGTYSFTATALSGGSLSNASVPFVVTVEAASIAPTVTVVVPASTTSLAPQVLVQANELGGLPDGTTVTLKVDLLQNGTYTGSATGILVGGYVTLTSPVLPSTGTFNMKAQVTDPAGNTGTSAVVAVTVTALTSAALTAAPALTDPQAGDPMLQVGNLQLSHALDLDTSPGTSAAGDPALIYNSAAVSVKPVIQAGVQTANSAALPGTISAALTWGGSTGATFTYSTTGASPGDLLTLAIQEPITVTSTGAKAWSLNVVENYGSPVTLTSSGTAYVVTQDSSPFGSGWSLNNVNQLVSVSGGVMFVYGTGFARFWAGSSTFTAPAGDNGTLTLSGSVYTYTMPDNEQLKFNSSGYETSWTSGDGLSAITYTYNGSNQVSTITAIDGTTSTFAYSGGLLQTIQTSNSRTTSFAYSGTNLTQVTNPDGGVHTFTYDGGHRATGETFANTQNSWAYSGSGALATITTGGSGSPSVEQLAPAMLQGLSSLNIGTVYAKTTDPALGTATFTYATKSALDAQGRALTQVAADGGVTVMARDGNGYVTAVTDPLGRTSSYALDSYGDTTLTTFPDGSTTSAQYQAGTYHLVTGTTDADGNKTTYTYDGSGHQLTVKDALSEVTSYAYDGTTGLQTTVTDPLNHTTTSAYDSSRRLTTTTDALNDVTTFTYDLNGNPKTTVDALGHTTTSMADVMGRVTQTVSAVGATATMTYLANGLSGQSQDANGNTTTPVYDAYNRGIAQNTFEAVGSPVDRDQLASLDNLGRSAATRDANGFWTQQAYDSAGRTTQSTDGQGNVSYSEYDVAGQLLATRDALGRVTKYAYDLQGRQTTVTDPQNNVTTTAYDANGNTTAVTDALNHVTTSVYDALNRATVNIDALGHRTTTAYDAAGNTSTVTDMLNHTTTYNYDVLNRQTAVTDALGHVSSTAYDKVGNTTTVADALNHVATYVYDSANRQTAVTDALNHTTTTAYDLNGNQTAVTDALSKVTTYTLDALNQVTQTTDANGNATESLYSAAGTQVGTVDGLSHQNQSSQNMNDQAVGSQDALGNLTQTQVNADGETTAVIDPVGNVTKYGYDSMGRQTTTTDPNGNVTTTAYDALSRVTSVTDGDGRQITYSYDNDNREIGEVWKNSGGTTVNTVTYTYDNNGQKLTAGDTNGTTTMAYDAQGRETAVTDVFGNVLTYTYDSANRMTLRADSGGGVQTYVYDNANRETSVQFGGSGLTAARADFAYTNRDQLSTTTRYSDVAGTTVIGTTAYGYDNGGRVTSITNKNSSAATISYYNYSYNSANLVTTETSGTGTKTYTYDSTNQLLSDGTTTYTYDNNGNQTTTGHTTGTGNELTNDGAYTYTYDNAGNQTEKSKGSGLETWYYAYDNRNRLMSVRETSNGTTNVYMATYTYDVFGERVETDTWSSGPGLVQTRTSYDNGKAWADLTTSNVVETRHLYDTSGNLVARIDVGTGLRQVFTDRQGSVVDVADTSGTVLDHAEYTDFGGIASETSSIYGGNYLYTGLFEDRIAGTYNAGARTDMTSIDRWMQVDPISFGGGQSNLYEYVGNDPTNATDPSGLESLKDIEEKYPATKGWVEKNKPDNDGFTTTIKKVALAEGSDGVGKSKYWYGTFDADLEYRVTLDYVMIAGDTVVSGPKDQQWPTFEGGKGASFTITYPKVEDAGVPHEWQLYRERAKSGPNSTIQVPKGSEYAIATFQQRVTFAVVPIKSSLPDRPFGVAYTNNIVEVMWVKGGKSDAAPIKLPKNPDAAPIEKLPKNDVAPLTERHQGAGIGESAEFDRPGPGGNK